MKKYMIPTSVNLDPAFCGKNRKMLLFVSGSASCMAAICVSGSASCMAANMGQVAPISSFFSLRFLRIFEYFLPTNLFWDFR